MGRGKIPGLSNFWWLYAECGNNYNWAHMVISGEKRGGAAGIKYPTYSNIDGNFVKDENSGW